MLYRDSRGEHCLGQRVDYSYFNIRSSDEYHVGMLISNLYSSYKPIGPTILVEWEE